MAIAGHDTAAINLTADLVRDTGLTPVLIGSLADSAPIGLAGLDPDADGGQRTPRQRWVSRVGSATSSSASTTSPGAVIIASWPVGSA